jgi:hypothetical protein
VTKQRHVRLGSQLADDETIVIRGGRLDSDGLRADAERYHHIYGDYGISVFAARDVSIDELAQQPPLVRFEVLTLVRVGVIRAAGFRLEATGRNPRHFTVVFDDLNAGIEALLACEQHRRTNPYHEG